MINLNQSVLSGLNIQCPTITEQRAIAGALSDVDALIGALDKLIAKKRDIKQAAMQQLLTGKKRLPGFHEEWQVKQLGEVGVFSKGRGIKKDEVVADGLPCIRYGEIYTRHNDYVRAFYSFITPAIAKQSQRIEKGDLLFAGSGETAEEIGKCVAFLGDEEAYAGGDIVIFRPVGQDYMFLGYLMNHSSVSSQKARMGQGDAVVHISARNLARLELQLPAQPEQIAIATVLSDMDAEIVTLERRRGKTLDLKQGMMQELLTGKTRLTSVVAEAGEKEKATSDPETVTLNRQGHNWQFNEAVIIAVLAQRFGNEKYPLGRLRYTKLSYLLHRHLEGQPEGYLKMAAGPYNPKTRYGGPEKIGINRGYIKEHSHEDRMGFITGENNTEALTYFEKWYGSGACQWLDQFRYVKNEILELWTTVDTAMLDLKTEGKAPTTEAVKGVIRSNTTWLPKLKRPAFSDENIGLAIQRLATLFAEK